MGLMRRTGETVNNIALMVLLSLSLALVPALAYTQAQAQTVGDEDSCGSDGYNDGQNGPFHQDRYNSCGDAYYQSFIEGCMDADNSREICEQATDAD
jgi:hypothetical protein